MAIIKKCLRGVIRCYLPRKKARRRRRRKKY